MAKTQKQMIEEILDIVHGLESKIPDTQNPNDDQSDTSKIDTLSDNVAIIASAIASNAPDEHLKDMLTVIRSQRDIIAGVLQYIAKWEESKREELSGVILNNSSWGALEKAQSRLDEYLRQREAVKNIGSGNASSGSDREEVNQE